MGVVGCCGRGELLCFRVGSAMDDWFASLFCISWVPWRRSLVGGVFGVLTDVSEIAGDEKFHVHSSSMGGLKVPAKQVHRRVTGF